MFKVIDNFLDENNFKILENEIFKNPFFPWYYSAYIDFKKNEEQPHKFQFNHVFYDKNTPNSNYYDVLIPLIEKLKCFSLIKIKANITWYSDKIYEGVYHVDHSRPDAKTAVFYLNTNNGYTKFKKNKKKINSVKNRMLIFDSGLEHLGTNTTDTKNRVVLNLNYF